MDINTVTLYIIRVYCYRQEERKADEIFIRYKGKRVWPINKRYEKMTEGEHNIRLEIPEINQNEKVTLELWDYDYLVPNDKLGTFNLMANEKGGPYKTDLNQEKGRNAKYTIEWEVS